MVDAIAPLTSPTGPFDTAAMQIAEARAQAAAAHTNEVAFLQEIAKTNDVANAQALDRAPATSPTDPLLANGVVTPDVSGTPTTDPSNLAFLTEFGSNVATTSSDSIKAEQLHEMGILQKDVRLLEEAANTNTPIPSGNSASTLDLSVAAQDIVAGTTSASIDGSTPLTSTQLAQIAAIVQPIANEPLNAALLQQIQTQLTAGQNPIQLSLNTIALAINFIAEMQLNPNHAMENTVTPNDNEVVAPVSAIDKVAVEDSAIR